MKAVKRISLGGTIFLLHFSCVAVLFLLPILVSQPQASITDGSHRYWGFLQLCSDALLWLTLPVSRFMAHGAGGALFAYWMNAQMFVPLCFILALNSLLIGYTVQLVVSVIRSRMRTRSV